MHADAGMGGARPARHEADARAAGQLAVGLGHVRRGTLMLANHQFDGGLVVQRVQHVEEAFARHAEDAVRAVQAQGVDQRSATATAAWRGNPGSFGLSGIRQGGIGRHGVS
ncbi:hypothetical protein D3C72_1129610 [compost metagenome]